VAFDQFRALIKVLPEPTFLLQGNGEILAVNPSLTQILGMTSEQVRGQNLLTLITNPAEKVTAYLQACTRSGQMVLGALTLQTADGLAIDYRCEGAVVQPWSPTSPALLLLRLKTRESTSHRFNLLNNKIDELGREIRERRQIEENLRQSQRLIQSITDTAPNALYLFDVIHQRTVYVNARAPEMLGYAAETFSQLDAFLMHLMHPEDLARFPQHLATLAHGASDTIAAFEYRMHHANGEWRWFLSHDIAYERTAEGQIKTLLGVAQDITERKQAEARLQLLAALSTVLTTSLDDKIMLQQVVELLAPLLADWCTVDLLNPDGAIELVAVAHRDPAQMHWAYQLRQRYPATPEMPGGIAHVLRTGQAACYPVVHEEDWLQGVQDEELRTLLRQNQAKSVILVPLQVRDQPLGVLTLVSTDANRRFNETDFHFAQELARRVALAVDNARLYAESRAAEVQLKEFNRVLEQRVAERTAELARSNEDLDQFAYIASHDLKAPLRAIDHLASWIRQDAEELLPDSSKTHLEKLRGRIMRMEALLNDLLAYSRAGRLRHPPEVVDTALLVNGIVEMLAPPPGFTVQIGEYMPILETERVPLETVLRNLIGNAIKHHDNPSAGQVCVSARDEGAFIAFTVCDNGPGIDGQFHERIFQMFQTLLPRDTVEGSGVGLAVVKKMVESRGGKIEVESDPGAGATFSFTWPKG